MPTYQYACTACGEELEAVQSFSDPSLTECPRCGGRLRKVFSAVGVVFKGSGFYKTDSRSTTTATDKPGEKSSDSRPDSRPDAKPDSKSDSRPDSRPDSKPGKAPAAAKADSASSTSTPAAKTA